MKIKFVLLFCSSLFLQTAFAEDIVKTPVISGPKVKVTMRDNGYTLGDMIAMHAEFDLAKDLVFDPNSVPLKGPVNNWLDLRNVSMAEANNADGGRKISIDFTWQIFGTVEHAQTLKIPAIQLQTIPPAENAKSESEKDDTEKDDTVQSASNKWLAKPLAITIPAQGFNLSPVLPPTITENKHRPHAPPLRFKERTPLMLAALFLSLGLLCGVLWLWLVDRISWWPRNPGPITQLSRQLRQTGVAQQSSFSAENLRTIHAGLAGSAGQSLYPNTLANLFEKTPYLTTEKDAITQFFNASWQVFYEKTSQVNTSTISVADTLRWINRSATAERLSRRKTNKKTRQKPIATNKVAKV
jgi:hypothetical protein